MENKNNILNELKDLGINLPKGLKSPNDVPVGYFDNFSGSVFELIKQENFLDSLPKKMPFEVESSYFSSLENDLKSKIFIDSLPKEIPFDIPANYFDGLEYEIAQKIDFPKKEIAPLRVHRKKYQTMSMAASIILFLGLGFQFLKPTNKINVEQQLSKISTTEIDAYIQQHQTEFSTDLATETFDASEVDVNKLENEIIESQIINLSEEDLKNYL